MNDLEELRKRLHWLRRDDSPAEPPTAEAILQRVLEALLFADGYVLETRTSPVKIDWMARKPSLSGTGHVQLGIEYRHFSSQGRPLGVSTFESVIQGAWDRGLDRLLLIARHGF
jgi:hypothetical protein